jgi:protein-L-isoaspartate(D-aspartate) O-methyltransferase
MDIEQARFNMVEQQIRTWEVLDQNVLDLLFVIRREEFVPPAYRMLAFADLEIPLRPGASMWSPKMEARVLQELKLEEGEAVLEIGTGSGYFTALLSAWARGSRAWRSIRSRGRGEGKAWPGRRGQHRTRSRRWRPGLGSATYDAIVLTGSTPPCLTASWSN